ncbi:hypothetical protein MKX03_001570, partial [Papaver bracteatum]
RIRDGWIPMEAWIGNRKRILVLNREDMFSISDRNAWPYYFANQGTKVVFANGKFGMGAIKLGRLAKSMVVGVNVKHKSKGLLPRVRAGIVGYPNVGKSSLINCLLKRRLCTAAPRPGVTRNLKWVHFGKDLELIDSPGIIPMRISDQTSAIKLAICDDIGERSYNVVDVAEILVQMLMRIPTVGASESSPGHICRMKMGLQSITLTYHYIHHSSSSLLTPSFFDLYVKQGTPV